MISLGLLFYLTSSVGVNMNASFEQYEFQRQFITNTFTSNVSFMVDSGDYDVNPSNIGLNYDVSISWYYDGYIYYNESDDYVVMFDKVYYNYNFSSVYVNAMDVEYNYFNYPTFFVDTVRDVDYVFYSDNDGLVDIMLTAGFESVIYTENNYIEYEITFSTCGVSLYNIVTDNTFMDGVYFLKYVSGDIEFLDDLPDGETSVFDTSYVLDINETVDGSTIIRQLLASTGNLSQTYIMGYQDGYSVGYSSGETVGYGIGYTKGFNEGFSADSGAITIFNGILNVAMVPVNFFLAIFNFEILGINLKSLVSALLTIAIIIIVIRLITGKKE